MFDKKNFSYILINISKYYENQREFARKSDVNRTYLSKYINKKLETPPKPDILKKIAAASFGVTSYEELMTVCGYINLSGLSDMNLKDNEKSLLTKMLLSYKEHLETNPNTYFDEQKFLEGLNSELKHKLTIAFRRNSLDILITTGKCNIPLIDILTNDIIDYIPMMPILNYENMENYFAVQAIDVSMSPLLNIDDIAIIYKQNNFDSGGTYLLKLKDGTPIIRKIVETSEGIELHAMNMWNYPAQKNISKNDIKILGKVLKAENKSAFE